MKWIHPNLSHAAAIAAIALVLGGCRNPSGGVANPFVTNDRVPPPATRAIAPGQAQPYYPGDPLPVMQSKTAPPPGGTTATIAEAPSMPSADTNLAWNSPGRSAPPPGVPEAAAIAPNAQPQPRSIASAEPTVAIPADGDALRFALPAPAEPKPFTPIAPAPIPVPQPSAQLAAAPATSGVVPSSYSEPSFAAVPPQPNPWRAPEIALTNTQPPLPPPPTLAPIITVPAPAHDCAGRAANPHTGPLTASAIGRRQRRLPPPQQHALVEG
jgi:hypothetical protein